MSQKHASECRLGLLEEDTPYLPNFLKVWELSSVLQERPGQDKK
jgi:hypothetical protein